MIYEVVIDNINREDWERYAVNFADYSIYQTWPYQQVRGNMDGQEISRSVIKNKDGSVVAMCQVRIKYVKLLRLKIGYIQWGPLFRSKDNKIVCTIEALKRLREAYLADRVNVLRIVPNARIDEIGRSFANMLRAAGFAAVPHIEPYHTFTLPVSDSEEDIRKRLHKSFRRDLKKAERTGLEIRQGNDDKFCKTLEELYLNSLKRKGFKGLDPQEFIQPQLRLSDTEKMYVIVAYLDGSPVSALLVSNLGDTAVVLLSASNKQGLLCGSSYLVWYRGAISALRHGMKWYDLGGIDPDNNPTVYQFKSRMGGEDVLHIGAFEAYSKLRAKSIWRATEKVYQLIKK